MKHIQAWKVNKILTTLYHFVFFLLHSSVDWGGGGGGGLFFFLGVAAVEG